MIAWTVGCSEPSSSGSEGGPAWEGPDWHRRTPHDLAIVSRSFGSSSAYHEVA